MHLLLEDLEYQRHAIEAKLDYRPYVAPVKDYQSDFKPKVPQP